MRWKEYVLADEAAHTATTPVNRPILSMVKLPGAEGRPRLRPCVDILVQTHPTSVCRIQCIECEGVATGRDSQEDFFN